MGGALGVAVGQKARAREMKMVTSTSQSHMAVSDGKEGAAGVGVFQGSMQAGSSSSCTAVGSQAEQSLRLNT